MAVAPLNESQAQQVLRQVEFYFSDSNLPRDHFLKKSVRESKDGLVSLAVICAFPRMRKHLGAGEVTPDEVPEETVSAVAETLRKSDFLKVSKDGKRVGRSTRLTKPEAVLEQVDSRTVAASPLPCDVSIEEVESFFAQYGKVNSVRLPRLIGDKKHFCGTALVEFSKEKEAKKFLTKSMVYAGAELEIKPKKDFNAEREKKLKEFEISRSNKDTSNGSYPKGLVVAFKLKSIKPEGPAEDRTDGNVNDRNGQKTLETLNENEERSAGIKTENGRDGDKDHSRETNEYSVVDPIEESEAVAKDASSAKGAVESNVSANDKKVVARQDLREKFQKFGNVKYITFSMGDESGYIRFDGPDAAVKARAAAAFTDEGGFVMKGYIVTLEQLSGEAEKEYWSALHDKQYKNRENDSSSYRGREGKQFHGRKQRQGDSMDERPNKITKFSDDE